MTRERRAASNRPVLASVIGIMPIGVDDRQRRREGG